jgi:hypothetical protein
MKSLLLLLLLALAAACADQKATQTAAPVADNEENRLAAAKKYLEVAPAQDLLKDMTAGVMDKLPEKPRKIFTDVMASQSLKEATHQIALKGLVKNFTANELNALTVFYSSPDGKSIRQKYSAYLADVMPQVNQELVKAFQAAQQKEQQAQPKAQEPAKPGAPPAPPAAQPPAAPKPPEAKTPPGPKPPEPKATPAPKPQEPKAQPAPPSDKPAAPHPPR